MISESPEASLESKLALGSVMDRNRNKDLDEAQSERNISDNLVVVTGFRGVGEQLANNLIMEARGVGTGLKLTTDGFVLTAYHNIQSYEDEWKRMLKENPPTHENITAWLDHMKTKYAVVDQRKNAYPIDITIWAAVPALDVALIKAVIPNKPKPIDFRIAGKNLKKGDEIKLLGLRDQMQYHQYGKVISANFNPDINDEKTGEVVSTTYESFLTDAYGVPGFSGGVFTNASGEFAGLALYIRRNGDSKIGHAGGAKASNIVNLVNQLAQSLGAKPQSQAVNQ